MDPGSACTHNPSPREMKFPRDPWASLLPDHGGPSILSEVRPGTGESLAADPDTHRKVVGFPKRPGRPSRPPFPGVANTKISQERSLVPGGQPGSLPVERQWRQSVGSLPIPYRKILPSHPLLPVSKGIRHKGLSIGDGWRERFGVPGVGDLTGGEPVVLSGSGSSLQDFGDRETGRFRARF